MGSQEGFDYLSLWHLGSLIGTQMALRAAIELNVFNIINDAGPDAQLSSAEIVAKIPTTNPNAATALERILRMLSAKSFFSTCIRPCQNGKIMANHEERTYGLTMVSHALVTDKDGASLAQGILFSSEREVVESLYMIKNAVLEPDCLPFNKANGVSFFEHIGEDPKSNRLFNQNMEWLSKILFDKVFKVYTGFDEVKELMDVGGGNGTSLGKIVSIYPHIHGINFDLPHVVADAYKFPGVKHVAGDMFESLPNAQTILLKSVLHDWDDDRCIRILRNCWKALAANGKVIVVEFAIPQELGTEAEVALVMDFYMMVVLGGKERSTVEFNDLAKAAGFAETKTIPIAQGLHVFEFIKTT